MSLFSWKGKTLETYGDLINAVASCKTNEEAQEFLHEFETINPHAREVIGYMIGNVNRDVGRRIIELFGCEHPIFGTTFPTFDEALKAGMKVGELVRDNPDLSYAEVLDKYHGRSAWKVGAL